MQSLIEIDPHLRHTHDSFVGMVSINTDLSSFREETRKELNLVCIIDTSHSMKDGKLNLVKTTLDFVIEHLTDKDRLSLVSFGSKATIDFDLLTMNNENKEIAKRKVNNMRYDGCTNLSGGLLLGLDTIFTDSKTRSYDSLSGTLTYKILLFTDGEANRGITEIEMLNSTIRSILDENISSKYQVDILTFGFGSDHDMDMLSNLSNITSNGRYYYIKDQDSIGPQFVECLGSLLSLVAQNTTLSIKYGSSLGYLIPKVWHSKHSKMEEQYIIPIGDVYYGQKCNIVFTFKNLFVDCELECSLSYFDVVSNTYIRNKIEKEEFSVLSSESEGEINPLILRNYQRVIVAEGIKEAMEIAETDLERAKTQIKELLEKLNEVDEKDILIEDLKECLHVMESRDKYIRVGRATLTTMSCEHGNQRGSHYTTIYQNTMVNELLTSDSYLNTSYRSSGNVENGSDDSRNNLYINMPYKKST